MNARLESLARQRLALVDRSALYRLRLRREAFAVRNSVTMKRTSTAMRMLVLAGRAVLVIRLARAAIGYAREPVKPQGYLP